MRGVTMSSNSNILEMKENLTKLVNGKKEVTLSECLSYSTRDELVQIATENGYALKKSLRKQEMIDVLVCEITKAFTDMLDGMIMTQFESIIFALRSHQTKIMPPDNLYYLTNRGFVYWMAAGSKSEEAPTLLFPSELIKLAFASFTEEGMSAVTERETIHLMLQAMCNLYGTFPVNLLHELYQKYNDNAKMNENVLGKVLEPSLDRFQEFYKINDYIVPDFLMEEEAYQTILSQSEGMEYYIPTFEELLYYASHEVNEECEQYKEVTSFFQTKIKDSNTLDKLMKGLGCLCVQDAMPNYMMSEVNNAGVIFGDVEEANKLLCLLTDLSNHTIKWVYKGNTPVAIGKLNAYPNPLVGKNVPIVKDEPKVYPNDPCPCGSGKKYKKCCAK
jgi:hypothetical protein